MFTRPDAHDPFAGEQRTSSGGLRMVENPCLHMGSTWTPPWLIPRCAQSEKSGPRMSIWPPMARPPSLSSKLCSTHRCRHRLTPSDAAYRRRPGKIFNRFARRRAGWGWREVRERPSQPAGK
ncbi:hypothetical protein NL676_039048 [Syzygium grande]|nr:hypothetical protein NL676_039048 [Syzygium grande]